MIDCIETTGFSPEFTRTMGDIIAYEESLRFMVDEGLLFGPELQQGQNSIARLIQTKDRLYVSKELKPKSRQALVFGYGADPVDVLAAERGLTPAPIADFTQPINPHEIAHHMRLHQGFLQHQFGTRTIQRTATYVVNDTVFQVQPWIHMSPIDPGEMNLLTRVKHNFYEDLKFQLQRALSSFDYYKLPRKLRAYLQTFGIDHGQGSNAAYLGLTDRPPFRLIDY
jgi:hypothetical protein